jgi:hypothetical protein
MHRRCRFIGTPFRCFESVRRQSATSLSEMKSVCAASHTDRHAEEQLDWVGAAIPQRRRADCSRGRDASRRPGILVDEPTWTTIKRVQVWMSGRTQVSPTHENQMRRLQSSRGQHSVEHGNRNEVPRPGGVRGRPRAAPPDLANVQRSVRQPARPARPGLVRSPSRTERPAAGRRNVGRRAARLPYEPSPIHRQITWSCPWQMCVKPPIEHSRPNRTAPHAVCWRQ